VCILRDEDGRLPKRVEGTKNLHLCLYLCVKVPYKGKGASILGLYLMVEADPFP